MGTPVTIISVLIHVGNGLSPLNRRIALSGHRSPDEIRDMCEHEWNAQPIAWQHGWLDRSTILAAGGF